MSHEIESALFVGQPAWHGLGTVVEKAPSVKDAIVMAGLDWEVRKEQLATPDGVMVDAYATRRSTDDRVLGVVGPQWTPLQNVDAFEFFEPLVESGDVQLEAAGSLRQGERIWVLAKANTVEVQKNDPIEQYILLSNGHDGKLAVRVGFTTTRVVCANTLAVAHDSAASQLIRVQHWGNVKETVKEIRELMDIASASFSGTAEQMRALVRKGCDEMTLRRYIREVFKPGKGESEEAAKQVVSKIVPLFEAGRGAELSRGTMWGAFNSVTEFLTHERGKDSATRLDSQWFGHNAKLINRALETAVQFAA